MQKEKLKENANPVRATMGRPHFEGVTKKQNGITLIALVITIIVMLILVAVTVSVALKGGLFSTAKRAAKGTETEKDKEIVLSSGEVEIDGLIYASMEDYAKGKIKLPANISIMEETEVNADNTVKNWDLTKVTAVKEGENKIPLPKGFQVSLKEGENTVSGGLVITDGTNEFVWIPVTDSYTEDNLGPLTATDGTSNCVYDSQEQLDYYYGEGYFNYEKDFNYAEDKTKIETSINKYKGFYVGRYETTIDENGSIGSKANTPVLTSYHTIKEGTNPNISGFAAKYRYSWSGLYKVQKDMYAGKDSVFSTMITSKEWDKIMSFTGHGDATRGEDTYRTNPDLSGSAYSTDPNKYDVSKNIYDLAGNVAEWTLKPLNSSSRVYRGGNYDNSSNSASHSNNIYPHSYGSGAR